MKIRKLFGSFLLITFVFIVSGSSAQGIPDGILFQALIRDPSGVPAKGRIVHIKDAILQSSATGNIIRCETFVLETSDEGVFTITIGKGLREFGSSKLSDIDWSAGPYFLNIKAAIEPTIPTPEWKVDEQYVDMGTSQFWTVPFAFKAATVAGMELMMRSADTTAMLAPYLRKTDTASLSSRIDQSLNLVDTVGMLLQYLSDTATYNFIMKGKLNISDTSAMMAGFREVSLPTIHMDHLLKTDTLFLFNLINRKLKELDTAFMLSPYLRKTDTAGMMNNYLPKNDTLSLSERINSKINITDTANMLSNYLHSMDTLSLSNRINSKINIADTAVMLSTYLQKKDTLSISKRINLKINTADTANMLNPYLRKKDTLSLNNRINLKINNADTANMLNPYLRKKDTVSVTDRINAKLNNTDTANMLIAYLRKKDTVSLNDRINAKINNTDTANMLDPYLRKKDTLLLRMGIDSKLAIADTANMLSPYLKNIADSSVSLGKIQSISGGKILGNPSPTAGAVSEINIGTGLTLSGNTLNATGGGSQVDTFTNNLVVYAANGLGKYAQGQTIPAKGKTAAQVLMDVIMQTIPPVYSQPTVGISSSPSGGTVETGTALNITLTASFTQNDAGAKTGQSFSKGGSALGSNTDNIASLTSAVSYTATVSYAQGAVKNNNLGTPDPAGQINAGSKTSGALTFTPQSKRYWGYASSITPTDAEIRAALGGSSELSSSKTKTAFDITISGGSNYIFFAYPASLGTLNSLSVGGFGSLPSFTLTTRAFTNANGYTQSYHIYLNQNAFSTPVTNITTN